MEEELYFKGKPLSELDLNGIAEAASLLHRAVPEPPTCCSDWRYEGEERDRDALMRNLGREDLYFMGKQLSELSLDEIAKASSLLVMALGAKTPEDYDGCRCNGDAAHDVVAYAWDAVWILDSEVTEALHNAQFEKQKHFDPSSSTSEEHSNPFAPGSDCNPFAYLANPDRGSEA